MRLIVSTTLLSVVSFIAIAQPPRLPMYSVNAVDLPTSLDKQVCISGMKYLDGKLYLASERCPVVFAFDPAAKSVVNTHNISVPQNFEMEGLTSYKDKLYLVSESIAAVYEVNPANNELKKVSLSKELPEKTKSGDGAEGIAANEKNNKMYILRERNDDMTVSQILTYIIKESKDGASIALTYESTIELPLENPQWRYSDICFDANNNRLICLKSFSKGKLRKQYLETIQIDENGILDANSLTSLPVENFSETSNQYKDQDYSMNLEGITILPDGTIYIISDNTSGKAMCDLPAKERTILLELKKK
jgi:uncharacterized protein YjiK